MAFMFLQQTQSDLSAVAPPQKLDTPPNLFFSQVQQQFSTMPCILELSQLINWNKPSAVQQKRKKKCQPHSLLKLDRELHPFPVVEALCIISHRALKEKTKSSDFPSQGVKEKNKTLH